MSDQSKLEIPYSVDTRVTGHWLALASTTVLWLLVCHHKASSVFAVHELPFTFLICVIFGLITLVYHNGRKISITKEGILIEPDKLLFYDEIKFYGAETLAKIKLRTVNHAEFARAYLEVTTHQGAKISLEYMYPSQAKYFADVLADAFQVPLDKSEFEKLNW